MKRYSTTNQRTRKESTREEDGYQKRIIKHTEYESILMWKKIMDKQGREKDPRERCRKRSWISRVEKMSQSYKTKYNTEGVKYKNKGGRKLNIKGRGKNRRRSRKNKKRGKRRGGKRRKMGG